MSRVLTFYGGPADGRTDEVEVYEDWAIAGAAGDVGWYRVEADMAFFTGELVAQYFPFEGGGDSLK